MRSRSLAAACLLSALPLTVAAPARADDVGVTGGMIAVKGINYADDTCVDIPVTYDFTEMPTDWSWGMDLDTTATGGVFTMGSGGENGVDSALWCPADVVGTFALTGSMEVRDAAYEVAALDDVTLTFEVRKRKTRVTIRTPDHTPKAGKVFRLKGCVSALAKREDYRDMQLQYRKPGGTWKRLGSLWTDEVGCYDEEAYIEKPGTRYVRAYVPATNSRTKAYSPALKLKAHK